jgi:Ca2+-binding EF-hand superfamily protein
VTSPVTVRAFQFLDPDGDAAITKAEFEKPGSRIVEFLDRNGDGAISMEDRREAFRYGHRDDDDN